ncbi:MAG TPA: hypothetical protein VLY21_04415 [Nitrososphaerales archaeon]|nr:hypothetical protein [Nitrososphaerales archaeon]
MATEYEELLKRLLDENRAKAAELRGKKGKAKELSAVESDIGFLEVELRRYEQGMSLFRTKGLPKVGRWGKQEAEEQQPGT